MPFPNDIAAGAPVVTEISAAEAQVLEYGSLNDQATTLVVDAQPFIEKDALLKRLVEEVSTHVEAKNNPMLAQAILDLRMRLREHMPPPAVNAPAPGQGEMPVHHVARTPQPAPNNPGVQVTHLGAGMASQAAGAAGIKVEYLGGPPPAQGVGVDELMAFAKRLRSMEGLSERTLASLDDFCMNFAHDLLDIGRRPEAGTPQE